MASNNSIQTSVVVLDENDVPGAILPRKTPEECNMQQLKRWLVCRGASSTGKKAQLVARLVVMVSLLYTNIRSHFLRLLLK